MHIPERIQKETAHSSAQSYPARVCGQYTGIYRLLTETGEVLGEISGSLRYTAADAHDLPVVGDWVLIDRQDGEHGNALITGVISRKSWIERSSAGSEGRDVQLLAANIDVIGICMALNRDFNLRRIERYLTLVYNSGAIPLIILTKTDLSEDPAAQRSAVDQVAFGVDVIETNSRDDGGFDQILPYLTGDRTIAFIGSSGVGKSTLINHLLESDAAEVKEVRSDGKGRHTTTARELFILPGGTSLIDTPGLRELQLSGESGLEGSFSDIESLAASCRFSDCTHSVEPGCAIREAISAGKLDEKRFENYVKMKHELSYIGLNSRQRENRKLKRMFKDYGSLKEVRDYIKSMDKRNR